MQKTQEDRWDMDPPRVTSFFEVHLPSPARDQSGYSPLCGFGWRFKWSISHSEGLPAAVPPGGQQEVLNLPDISGSFPLETQQENRGRKSQLSLWFSPHLCLRMALSKISIEGEISGACKEMRAAFISKSGVKMTAQKCQLVAGYECWDSTVAFTITLKFEDQLSFPTSPATKLENSTKLETVSKIETRNTIKALEASLDQPLFADAKFYLYSAKIGDRPGCPKALFGNSALLGSSCAYLANLLYGTGFKDSPARNFIYEEDSNIIHNLSTEDYDYDSDSDLESMADDEYPDLLPSHASNEETKDRADAKVKFSLPYQGPTAVSPAVGRSFAINGIAYQTWRAYIMYTYTDTIGFNPLKSSNNKRKGPKEPQGSDSVRCSPKSMYRFANHANIPTLKRLAKTGIKEGLTKGNIVAELFSSFTSQHKELIELEADFLVHNFLPEVERAFDETLQTIVRGGKPYSYQVLAFAMKRLQGRDAATAWALVDSAASALSPYDRK